MSELLTAYSVPESLARTRPPTREPLRLGLVQERWHHHPEEHQAALADGIRAAAGEGARIVCLQELTLARYFAITPEGPKAAGAEPEELEHGPTFSFAARLAGECGIYVHASLYERADAPDGLGYNTAIIVAPDGTLAARTRKLHIPVTAGYYEDKYFRPGPADGDPFPVIDSRRCAARRANVLGPVVPGARARVLSRRRRGADLPDGDRVGARPPGVRHRAAVAASDRRQRRRERDVHGRDQPYRRRGADHVLRFELHLGPVRACPRAGAA